MTGGNTMKRMPFQRPTEHYNELLLSIDEKICSLLKERRELSNNHPGFPPEDVISNWAKKYGLYEDYLNALFGTLRMEEYFRPRVEPTGFRKHLLMGKSVEIEGIVYSITAIRQFENASVVQLHVDWHEEVEDPRERHRQHHHQNFELMLGDKYDCRQEGGGGSTGHFTYRFIVSPPLPDDVSGLKLVFIEHDGPFDDKPTGREVVIQLE